MLESITGSHDRRAYVMVGLVLAGVAAVGVSTGVLMGLAGGGKPPPQRRTPTPQAVVAPPAPPAESLEEATPPADSDVEPGRRRDVGYFLSATQESDGVHVTFDRVQFFAGDDAVTQARKRDRPPPPSGVLVVNENPRTRELVLSPDVVVLGGIELAGSAALSRISVEQLLAALGAKGATTALDVRYDELGYVVEVREKQLS